jgi:hypothetical protein
MNIVFMAIRLKHKRQDGGLSPLKQWFNSPRLAGKHQISLREFMDMCVAAPVEGLDFTMTPLSGVYSVEKKGG